MGCVSFFFLSPLTQDTAMQKGKKEKKFTNLAGSETESSIGEPDDGSATDSRTTITHKTKFQTTILAKQQQKECFSK